MINEWKIKINKTQFSRSWNHERFVQIINKNSTIQTNQVLQISRVYLLHVLSFHRRPPLRSQTALRDFGEQRTL
jgi:hypothetical protein